MTEKSNDITDPAQRQTTPGSEATSELPPVSSGLGVGSPYDAPTGKFPRVDLSANEVPRTDDELGIDPDVPTNAMPTGTGGAAVADTDNPYSYASIPPADNPPGGTRRLRRRGGDERRGTLDFGLFVLRLVVGATFLYHGLQKLTGWFHGPGLDGVRDMMAGGGWDHPSQSAVLVTAGEVGGGALLILGLATPLAGGAVLAVILDAWAWKQGMLPGFQYKAGDTAVESESVLAGIAAAVILTGPGRWSFDRGRRWATRPGIGSFLCLVLAIAAAVAAYWYLHGGNPLVGVKPFD